MSACSKDTCDCPGHDERSGAWYCVAKDADGDPREWCGRLHRTADEAVECTWSPPVAASLHRYVLSSFDFDPEDHAPCVHTLHPDECARCLAARPTPICVHGTMETECSRCIEREL